MIEFIRIGDHAFPTRRLQAIALVRHAIVFSLDGGSERRITCIGDDKQRVARRLFNNLIAELEAWEYTEDDVENTSAAPGTMPDDAV